MAAPQALVGGSRRRAGEALDASQPPQRLRRVHPRSGSPRRSRRRQKPVIRGTSVAGFVAFSCLVLTEGVTRTVLIAERHL
jgi:hypothetical protein